MAGQKKKHSPLLFSFDSSLSFWRRKLVDFQFLSHSLNTEFEHKGMNMAAVNGARNELRRSCVQICVQSKRKSSYDLFRNCLIFKEWSHLDNGTIN